MPTANIIAQSVTVYLRNGEKLFSFWNSKEKTLHLQFTLLSAIQNILRPRHENGKHSEVPPRVASGPLFAPCPMPSQITLISNSPNWIALRHHTRVSRHNVQKVKVKVRCPMHGQIKHKPLLFVYSCFTWANIKLPPHSIHRVCNLCNVIFPSIACSIYLFLCFIYICCLRVAAAPSSRNVTGTCVHSINYLIAFATYM